MTEKLVPTIRTTPSALDFARALLVPWPDASKAAAGVLYAQFAGETTRGQHCYGHNLANYKWSRGCRWDYHALNGVWEGAAPAEAERLIASGQAIADPSKDHAKAVGAGKVSIILLPTHPGSWFRAYPSLEIGMRVFIDAKRTPGYRYSSAWAYALAGDCDGYARELGHKGYYTASPDVYSANMLAHHAEWMRRTAFEEATGTLPPPALPATGDRVRILATRLNVRAETSTSAPILATLRQGDVVEVTRNSVGEWVHVHIGVAVAGWVARRYVEIVDHALEALVANAPTAKHWVDLPIIEWSGGKVPGIPDTVACCPICSFASCDGDHRNV